MDNYNYNLYETDYDNIEAQHTRIKDYNSVNLGALDNTEPLLDFSDDTIKKIEKQYDKQIESEFSKQNICYVILYCLFVIGYFYICYTI